MNKQTITIIVLSGIIIGYLIFALTRYFTKNELEIKYFQRDSISQIKVNQFQDSIIRLKLDNDELRRAIIINEIGTEKERIIYLKKKEQILNQNANTDYNNIIEYLNSR